MELKLEGVKQRVKSLEDARTPDMKYTWDKLKATNAALGALGSGIAKLSDVHKTRCKNMEEGLQDLREKTHQRLEQVWETM